jgi:hypothetical protein
MRPINKTSSFGIGHGLGERPYSADQPLSFTDHVLSYKRYKEIRTQIKKKPRKKRLKLKAQWKKVVGTV